MDKTRTRLVNFRVTDEEFQKLKTATALRKARCLSEFARSIVLRTADEAIPFGKSLGDERMASVDRRLAHLESNVHKILDALRKGKFPDLKEKRS